MLDKHMLRSFMILLVLGSHASVRASPAATTQVANVLDFGAVGDGQTDDILALEKALNSLNGAGGTVLFPGNHQYAISRPLIVSGYSITLQGQGARARQCGSFGTSILSLTSNSTMIVFHACTFCGMSHMLLTHAYNASAGNASPADCARELASISRVTGTRSNRKQSFFSAFGDELPAERGSREGVGITPTDGAAVVVTQSFQTTISFVWIQYVFRMMQLSEFANTITVLDSQMTDVYGPCGICLQGGGNNNGTRVDILQISRLTMNNQPAANSSVVWIDIGAGVNSVRLDNVALINGGTGIRMDSPANDPAGYAPGRPLFLFANDLEIDFPRGNAIELLGGEDVQISNSYIQGAGSTAMGPALPGVGVGLLVGPKWNSEILVTNSRFFGHALSAVDLQGGTHTLFSNNMIGDNSIRTVGGAPDIIVRANVSNFIIQGNHIGNIDLGQAQAQTSYGIMVEAGGSNNYIISSNTLIGNLKGGLSDAGQGSTKTIAGNLM